MKTGFELVLEGSNGYKDIFHPALLAPYIDSLTFTLNIVGVNPARVFHLQWPQMLRYKPRWKVEKGFSRLQNFRRLVDRWEHSITVLRAFFQVACIVIMLR